MGNSTGEGSVPQSSRRRVATNALQNDESLAYAGLSRVRRRGLEPPPGYPGPGPQPCHPGVRYVQIVRQRPERARIWTQWTVWTIWMLPRMLPRPTALGPGPSQVPGRVVGICSRDADRCRRPWGPAGTRRCHARSQRHNPSKTDPQCGACSLVSEAGPAACSFSGRALWRCGYHSDCAPTGCGTCGGISRTTGMV